MRNLKKFLALVLAMLMVVSASAAVSAYDDVDDDNAYAEAIATLTEYGIVNGIGGNLFGVEDSIERYQMALMMARALNPAETDWATGMSVFDDVDEWYGAIAYAYMNGIVTGIGNNLFAPHEGIKYQDALIMAVRALGYKVDVSGDPYWLAAYNQAQALGLTKNVAVYKGEQVLNRAETAQVITNMIKATPADGGATIEAKNFGVATAENTTTFVITATENQAYSATAKPAEKGYVGVQEIVNGVPTGEIVYLPVAVFGIEAKEVDDYFGYAFDFINYNAKTGAFDKIVAGLEPTVVYNNVVTKNSDTKLTIDGTAYYTVNSIEGSALKNEIVIYNGGSKAKASKILLTNKDGDIVNYNGEIVATFAYETSTGAKYYVDQQVTAADAKVITEATALTKYGVIVDNDTFVEYETLTAENIADYGNYQLTLFDDNKDGKFDRAIVNAVYMSAYKAPNSSKEYEYGAMKGDKATVVGATLTKGDVFTYTYNKQTMVINVIDVLEPDYGILEGINTVNYQNTTVGANYYAIKLTIDGKTYTLGNQKREEKGLTGATIFDKVTDTYANVAKEARIDYLASAASLTVGSPIRYIANGTEIIIAETYSVEENYTRIVLKDLVDWDGSYIYVDFYLNGKLYEDAKVSTINGKKVSDLNWLKLADLIADKDIFAAGNIFRAVSVETDGSYQLSTDYMTKANASATCTNYGLNELVTTQKPIIVFNDGIADTQIISNVSSNINSSNLMIRATSKTIFYFINNDGKVSVYVGAPDKSSIDLNNAKVFADKIGYTGSTKGEATIVVVYYTDANALKGFGVSNVEYATVYVSTNGNYTEKYTKMTATALGLTDKTGEYYAYNVDNLAVDMATGEEVQVIYSKNKLEPGKFYTIDSDKVVKEMVTVETATVAKSDFVQLRYYKDIDGVFTTNDKISTVKLVLAKFDGTVYTNKFDKLSDINEIAFIKDYEDGVFVAVILSAKENTTPTVTNGKVTIVANAKWVSSPKQYAAQFSYDVTDTKVTGSIILTDVAFPANWNDTVTGNQNPFGPATYDVELTSTALKGTATVNTATGCLDITIVKIQNSAVDSTVIPAGAYTGKVNVDNGDYIEFSFIVK